MMHTNMHSHSKTFVIAFSSQPEHLEWEGYLSRLNVKYALLADETDNYYQEGIPGVGYHHDVLDWLNRIDQRYHHPVYLGLSAGAYAALFYNAYTKPHRVIAISPVTGAGPLADFDPKWHPRLNGRPHIRVTDLSPLYRRDPEASKRVTAIIGDGDGTELDAQMCMRINVPPSALIKGVSHAGLGKWLAHDGERMLENLIKGQ